MAAAKHSFRPTAVPHKYVISVWMPAAAASERLLSYLFPRDERCFQSRADENAASRVEAGIHFRSAAETGVALGREVKQAVVERAKHDGAD